MDLSRKVLDFERSLDTAKQLVLLEKTSYPDALADNSRAVVNGLRGGAVVLMVASFEHFLSTIFTQAGEVLTSHTTAQNFHLLPDRFQVEATFATLKSAMEGPRGAHKDKFSRLPAIRNAARLISEHEFSSGALARTDSNPNAETVKTMFARFGLTDSLSILDERFQARWFKPEANSFFRATLNDIVNRRHQVAHSGQALAVPVAELDVAISFLETAAATVAAVLEDHLSEIVGRIEPDNLQ